MCPSTPRECSEPGGQKPVLSLSLDLITENRDDANFVSTGNIGGWRNNWYQKHFWVLVTRLGDYAVNWNWMLQTGGDHIGIPDSFHFVDVISGDTGVETTVEVIKHVDDLHRGALCGNSWNKPMGRVTLVAATGTTSLVPCHKVKYLQLIGRSGTCRWNLRVPYLQMRYREVMAWMSNYIPLLHADTITYPCPY